MVYPGGSWVLRSGPDCYAKQITYEILGIGGKKKKKKHGVKQDGMLTPDAFWAQGEFSTVVRAPSEEQTLNRWKKLVQATDEENSLQLEALYDDMNYSTNRTTVENTNLAIFC